MIGMTHACPKSNEILHMYMICSLHLVSSEGNSSPCKRLLLMHPGRALAFPGHEIKATRHKQSQRCGLAVWYLVVLKELVVYADGLCTAAHAIVQLCLKIQPGYRSVLRLLLHCFQSFFKLLQAE